MTVTAEADGGAAGWRTRAATALPAVLVGYLLILWPLVYGHGTITADLATGPMPEASPQLLNRLVFPAAAAVAVVLLVAERHRRAMRFHLLGAALVGGFFALLGASAAWAAEPTTSLSKFVLLALETVALLPAVLAVRRVDDLIRPLFWVVAAALTINLAAVAVLPPTPIGHAGIYAHKNTLGAVALLGGLFALYGTTRSDARMRLAGCLLLPVVGLLMVLSRSKTSLALLFVVPVLAFAAGFLGRRLRIALPIVLAVGAAVAIFLASGAIDGISAADLSRMVSGDDTFTGRSELWRFAAGAIAERPILGWGYQSFWGVEGSPQASLPDGFLRRTPHAHNGYLDLLLQGGVVALVLFLAMLTMAARRIDRIADADPGLGFLATALRVEGLLLDLLETDWLQSLSASSLLATLLILVAAVKPREGRSR
jgi:hypothetical protein